MRILILKVVSVLSLLGLAVLSFVLSKISWEEIESHLARVPYRCPLKALTGFQCALCGMTHSWLALLKGNIHRAFHFNPLGPLLLVLFCLICFFIIMGNASSIEKFSPTHEHKRISALIAVCGLSLFMVARNIFKF